MLIFPKLLATTSLHTSQTSFGISTVIKHSSPSAVNLNPGPPQTPITIWKSLVGDGKLVVPEVRQEGLTSGNSIDERALFYGSPSAGHISAGDHRRECEGDSTREEPFNDVGNDREKGGLEHPDVGSCGGERSGSDKERQGCPEICLDLKAGEKGEISAIVSHRGLIV